MRTRDTEKTVQEAVDIYLQLRRTAKILRDLTSSLLAESGLTESQAGTLEALYYLGPMCQIEIGERLLVTGGNMTLVVNNLEKRGLISRQRSREDRRQMVVSLTEKGYRLIDGLYPSYARHVAELMSTLSVDEQQELGRLCRLLGEQNRDDSQCDS